MREKSVLKLAGKIISGKWIMQAALSNIGFNLPSPTGLERKGGNIEIICAPAPNSSFAMRLTNLGIGREGKGFGRLTTCRSGPPKPPPFKRNKMPLFMGLL